MDSNLEAKCFICNVACSAENKYLGTMQMESVLVRCIRVVVDVEHEHFCAECVRKIEDYDQLVQITLQIETELYELYRRKSEERCFLLDAEVFAENTVDEVGLMQTEVLQMEKQTTYDIPSAEVSHEPYDDGMVVEYLDDYEAQSDDDEFSEEQKELTIDEQHENATDFENGKKSKQTTAQKVTLRKVKSKRSSARNRAAKIKEEIQSPDELNEGQFKCYRCPFVGVNRSDLEEHKMLKHVDDVNRLQCGICGRSYKSKSALCVHIGIHNGRNSHECHICGGKFTQRGALVRHLPMHTGEQPHQCDVCGKRFTHYSSFHMHQMVHTNERKKKCSICGSAFRSNSHMTRHMRSHTGEKPFSCPICGQTFAQRYNMKTHYNTHQGIHRPQSRNHKCIICSEAFPRREKLNKHLQQRHRICDSDIKNIAEHGPESEISKQIIERLKATVDTKEEIFIEFESIDSGDFI